MDMRDVHIPLLKMIDLLGMDEYQKNQVRPTTANQPVDATDKVLQNTLDYLRVCIQYRCLDLEATRRENTILKKLLKADDPTGEK